MLVGDIGQVISQLTTYDASNSVPVCLQGWAYGSSKTHPALMEFTSQRRDKTHACDSLQAVGRKGAVRYLTSGKRWGGLKIGGEGYLKLDLGTRTHQKGSGRTQN